MRIGLVGLDSSHADHFVHHFNVEQEFGDARVEAVCGADRDRAHKLARMGSVPIVVDEPAALLGRVDAVIVGDRDGGLHSGHATLFLSAGLPVLVDKPLATRLSDATALIDAAERGGAPLTSASALRWAQNMDAVRAAARTAPWPHVLLATGPADRDSPWGGLSFYGVHVIEMVLAVAHGPVGELTAQADDGCVVATTTVGRTRVVFTMVRPTQQEALPFQLQLVSPGGIVGGELTLGDRYMLPVMAQFVTMVRTGRAPLSYDELLAPVIVLHRIEVALGRAAEEESGRRAGELTARSAP